MERQFGKDMVLTVSGIFSRGVNLYGTQDINAPALGAPFTYTISGAPAGYPTAYSTQVYNSTVRPNPNFGPIYEETNGVSSWYDGLSVTFLKRFSHGIQMDASYSWSHEIDDGQGAATNAIFSDSATPFGRIPGQYGFDKGSGAARSAPARYLFVHLGADDYAFQQRIRQVRSQQLAVKPAL